MIRVGHSVVAAGSFILLLVLSGCPSGIRKAEEGPESSKPQQRAESETSAPDNDRASFEVALFLPPPEDAEHPERAVFNEDFRRGALTFTNAGWEFRELDLSSIPHSAWRSRVAETLSDHRGIIFTYQDAYVQLIREIAEDQSFSNSTTVIALTESANDIPPQVVELRFHTEDLGYLAGLMAAELTKDGHVAVFSFADDSYSDRFVAGFSQGLALQRAGASLRDLRVTREEMAEPDAGAKLMAEMLRKVNIEFDPNFGVDVVAFWTNPLGEIIAQELAQNDIPVISGVVLSNDTTPSAPVTSLHLDFSAIPQFLVDNAEALTSAGRRNRQGTTTNKAEDATEGSQSTEGATLSTGRHRYLDVRLSSGILKVGSFDSYLRFHSLSTEFRETVDFYTKALSVGEVEVKPHLQVDH